jgi:hypothetical protein
MAGGELTDAQIAAWLRDGAVTVDTPLTRSQLDAVSGAMAAAAPQRDPSATRSARTCDYTDESILGVIAHPWLERVACQVLCAPAVTFFQTALINAWPEPSADASRVDLQTLESYHCDMQYTEADLAATPRRMQVSFFIWISDVPLGRANLFYRPGTHRKLARIWAQQEDLFDQMPRIHGTSQSDLPAAVTADGPLPPAVPVVATAGQATVLTTGMLHSATPNVSVTLRPCCLESASCFSH